VEEGPSSQGAPEEIRAVITALQDTLRRIRAEDEQARLLASGLAHELRSPLQNLIGETQVALLREREASEYRQVLESHLEDLGDLSRVVDNLVSLASIDEARRRMVTERFDLVAEARLRMKREDKLAERRGVRMRFLAEGSCEVEGDRESLLLALRNLVTNAIEWTPRGGGVELSIRSLGDGLEILVDDAGPGVPESERATLFQPFRRGRTAEGRRVGFGLGLALTQSAVAAQGGTIEVGDSPLGGARFRVRLPLRNSA
jgi:signal transduction histidine kinase